MSKKKLPRNPPKNQISLVRSSAAEYLIFVAASGKSETSVEMRYEDENIWLTQKMMATLYDVTVPAINQHLKRIFADHELDEKAVIKHYLTTAADGKNYQVKRHASQVESNFHRLLKQIGHEQPPLQDDADEVGEA